ncbi:energy transducer TonB [Azospirillum sp. A39]|uniref:energy transducer TonB n=1 Tax=Azospirillum sp. A39 TaxID=3462279 RepID=UPI004045CF58
MTRLPDPVPPRRTLRGALRWTVSLIAVLTAHVGGAVALVAWQTPPPPAEPPLAAVMIDLAPLPSAPTVQSSTTEPAPVEPPPPEPPPPEPEPEPEPEPPPPEPEPEPEPEPPPPVPEPPPEPPPPPPEVEPAVSLEEPPPPPPKPKPTPPKPKREVVRDTKPPKPTPPPPASAPSSPLPPAPSAAAPAQSAPSSRQSAAVPRWRDRLLGHLERHKRYPRAAQLRRQEGVAYVRFTIDRQGNVLSARLERTSGHRLLDEETVELVQRASPLPPPPDDVGDDRVELVVPVQFFLR